MWNLYWTGVRLPSPPLNIMLHIEQLEKRQCLSWGPISPDDITPAQPVFPDTAVADTELENLYQSYNHNGIDFLEMRNLFQSTDDDGYTDRLEYLQLKRYLRLGATIDYVSYFASAALYGNYTTSDTVLFNNPQPLIDKWFNGKDLPVSSYPKYIPINGQLFVDGINQEDAKQQVLGDCYFISTIGAIAQNNPQTIRDTIWELDSNLWCVRFYDNAGDKHFVTVNNYLPANSLKESVFADWGDNNELWPALLEKAYAQASPNRLIRNKPNNYRSIEWGSPQFVYKHILNEQPTHAKGLTKQSTITYLNNNIPMVISFNRHTYTFEYYNSEEDTFFLRNPYQTNHIYKTWQELLDLEIVGDRMGCYVFDVKD